jgi:hypothetical protein
MKVDYDSEGRSLLFEFGDSEDYDRVKELSGGECIVWVLADRAVSIQLLSADRDIAALDEAAENFDLDAEGLRAAAHAALDAPDREITIEIGRKRLVGTEARAA